MNYKGESKIKRFVPIIISIFAVVIGIVFVINGITTLKNKDLYDSTVTATEVAAFGIYYTGADENDKPNLIDILDDWGDFKPNYYSGTFSLKQ